MAGKTVGPWDSEAVDLFGDLPPLNSDPIGLIRDALDRLGIEQPGKMNLPKHSDADDEEVTK